MYRPFFLSPEKAREAFEEFVLPGIQHAMRNKRVNWQHLHIVVLNPCVPFKERARLPILIEYSIGERLDWEEWGGRSFDDFARAKAMISWRTGKSSREVALTMPHLLIPRDTSLWGSAVIDGVICAISGVQPYFDEMFARMTCAAMLGEASHTATDYRNNPDVPDFLS